MADNELVDAREAMALLGINETELQALVARGDLRAFRTAGTMKFKREDVIGVRGEKSTEPTIIVPTAGAQKSAPGAKGPAKPGAKPPAAPPAGNQENATGEILIDDFELVPTDDVASTQQVTVQQAAVTGGQTTVEPPAGTETIVEGTPAEQAAPPSPSRRAQAAAGGTPLPAAPAISRLRAATSGVHSSASKRLQAEAAARTAHPVMTAFLIVTTIVFLYTASICAVMMFRGSYDPATHQRVIPPFLSDTSPLPVYRWTYYATPGTPQDDRPGREFPAVKEK